MNNKQKLHQIKLKQWASLFPQQASSGLTVKVWCAENNISVYAYNYWKHKLKQEYVEASLSEQHDIVPLTTQISELTNPVNPVVLPSSFQSLDSREIRNTISISTGDALIQVTAKVSDEYLLRIIKAVRHQHPVSLLRPVSP